MRKVQNESSKIRKKSKRASSGSQASGQGSGSSSGEVQDQTKEKVKPWHRCERWHRLGIVCPIPHRRRSEGDDDDEDPDEDEPAEIKIFAEREPVSPKQAALAEVEIMLDIALEVAQTPVPIPSGVGDPTGVPTSSGGGFRPSVTENPPPFVVPPMKGPSGGSTPEMIGEGGGPSFPTPGPGLAPALVIALATAAIVFKAGPAPLRAAAAVGSIVPWLELGELESAFTALLGIREGRFQDPRPEERAFEEANVHREGGTPVPNQVLRPAKGFLIDLSQMFVPPEPELGGSDVAR